MSNLDAFISRVNNKDILELFFSLSIDEKDILNDFGAQHLLSNIDYNSFYPKNLCQYLWVSAANIIPQGYYTLAEGLLQKALNYADDSEDLGHIHANLAQIHADQENIEECIYHCDKTLETGFFSKWAMDLRNNHTQNFRIL